jgi:hypothetical protein
MAGRLETYFYDFLDWLHSEHHITDIQRQNLQWHADRSPIWLIRFLIDYMWIEHNEAARIVKDVTGMELCWNENPAVDWRLLTNYPCRGFLKKRAVPLSVEGKNMRDREGTDTSTERTRLPAEKCLSPNEIITTRS